MSNIECDQKMRPRAMSQSHNPQRPRFKAVSMRPRTASKTMSASRARVDCQWKAKPRMRTTKPVVADRVTVNAVSDRQPARAWERRCSSASLAERRLEGANGGEGRGAVGQRRLENAGVGREGGERLRRSENVDQRRSGHRRRRCGGDDAAVGVGDIDLASAGGRTRRAEAAEQGLRPRLDVEGRLASLTVCRGVRTESSATASISPSTASIDWRRWS